MTEDEMDKNSPSPTPGPAIETKRLGGRLVETKQGERNGVAVGLVAGYMATWDIDSGGMFGMPDRFERGAFATSLVEHRRRGDRPIRLKDQHGRTIGGFPLDGVLEDSTGLFGTGEINLETQQGREAFSLARQGVLTDFSVGFSSVSDSVRDGVRVILEAKLWETSIVDEPANQAAKILEVKTVSRFADLPIADQGAEWQGGQTVGPDAFLWAGGPAIACEIKGSLVVIPVALEGAAKEIQNSADTLTPETRAAAIRHLERYFAKAGLASPFAAEDRQFYGALEAKTMTRREFEAALAKTGAFSKSAVTTLAARLADVPTAAPATSPDQARYSIDSLLEAIQETKESLRDC